MNTAPYIGLPFADHGRDTAGFDCYGLVRHVLKQELGIELPDYGGRYSAACDRHTVADAIKAGLIEGWQKTSQATVGALAIFKIAGKPWHVGIVVGRDRFLHIPPDETSCVERLSDPRWKNRIEGYYIRSGMNATGEVI